MLMFEAGSMPKLERLDIDFDAEITISVTNGRLDFGLEHLSQLTEVRGYTFGIELSILRVQAAIERALNNHPKLPRFLRYLYSPAPILAAMMYRERVRPRRRSQSTVHTTQPRPPSIANLSEQEVVQEPADDAVACTSGMVGFFI
jgi:hypothetical protein